MDNDHGITGELREWIDTVAWLDDSPAHKNIIAIADRIDAEHESACAEAYGNGVESVALPDMTAYVKLPVDADGVPIRIGDKVDSDHHEDGTVTGIQFNEMPRGIRTLVAVRPDGWDVATWHTPDEYRHHHAPTVEDVLHELVDEWVMADSTEDEEAAIAECAKKLQLRGDEQ